MTTAQLVFTPLLLEHIERYGYGIITPENWIRLTNYTYPRIGQQYYIREFGRLIKVTEANFQRNEIVVECEP